ncbi:MAG: FAD synthetase family protein [Clostridia bacterium]|nr:FAD synthetase family protein [Clostridia bacterium]
MALIELTETLKLSSPTAICLGTFDGVHLAHQRLIQSCVQEARKRNLVPSAFTFEMPPAMLLRSASPPFMLTPIKQKERLLSAYGIQNTVYALFTDTFSSQSCSSFFNHVLLEQLNAKHIVIGFHYRFGRKAEGNAAMMEALCTRNGITCQVIQPVYTQDGQLISSTAIRRCIIEGDRIRAEEMLGRKLSSVEEKMLGGALHD